MKSSMDLVLVSLSCIVWFPIVNWLSKVGEELSFAFEINLNSTSASAGGQNGPADYSLYQYWVIEKKT